MIFVALLIGITLPAALGWIALAVIEGRARVLSAFERICWALILGPTLMMLIVFCCEALGIVNFSALGFLLPAIITACILAAVAYRTGALSAPAQIATNSESSPRWAKIAVILLILWTALKLGAGAYDLISVPTYWDDGFNNWNMRGKMFFVTQELQLELPIGNQMIQDEQGVSSYPPGLPLFKTWLSALAGAWHEPLVNGIHLLWIVSLLGALFYALRREASVITASLGVYLLVSLPLVLIQATNPYADIFLAAHLFLAVYSLYRFAGDIPSGEQSCWLRLFGFSLGLLLFTKNEATMIYAPILVLLLAVILYKKSWSGILTSDLKKQIGLAALLALFLALPWLLFKLTHGLSFGNAKAVSGLQVGFSMPAVRAIWFHFTHGGSWLLLPLALPFIVLLGGRRAWHMPILVLTLFICLAVGMQFGIFTFTQLSTEAIKQTGLGRGIVQITPVITMLMVLLGRDLLRARDV